MKAKKPRKMTRKVHLNLTLEEDLARRLRAYASYHGIDVSEVVSRSVKPAMKGFSVRQEGPRLAAVGEDLPAAGDRQGGEEAA